MNACAYKIPLCWALLLALGPTTLTRAALPLRVTVSIPPQKYFVERIGGDRVAVNVMVGPGESPATYEPRPSQLAALTRADAYFSIGVPFERAWMGRIRGVNPKLLVVDTSRDIQRQPLDTETATTPDERTLDPHIWLSPQLVRRQAATIEQVLSGLDPPGKPAYQRGLDRFLADIDTLDRKIRNELAAVKTRRFLVFHPAWGYFAREYGLTMIPIEIGGQEPSPAELARFITEARRLDARVIFAQPEFSTRAAETIARALHGKVVLISPLAEDWLANMRRAAHAFREALTP